MLLAVRIVLVKLTKNYHIVLPLQVNRKPHEATMDSHIDYYLHFNSYGALSTISETPHCTDIVLPCKKFGHTNFTLLSRRSHNSVDLQPSRKRAAPRRREPRLQPQGGIQVCMPTPLAKYFVIPFLPMRSPAVKKQAAGLLCKPLRGGVGKQGGTSALRLICV
jgi:hypothetical protein